jgi:hypothetical protein
MSTPEVLACLQNEHNIFGWCRLNDLLLVPLPLDPAVPLPYVYDIAPTIPNDLHLDMVEVVKMPLHKHGAIPKQGQGLEACEVEVGHKVRHATNDPHALSPPPPHACLDDDQQPGGAR